MFLSYKYVVIEDICVKRSTYGHWVVEFLERRILTNQRVSQKAQAKDPQPDATQEDRCVYLN